MKRSTKLCELKDFEEFSIPSINRTGTLISNGLGSSKVIYKNVQLTDKMGKRTSCRDVTQYIAPETEVITHGNINSKLQKRFSRKNK
jgi:hypothetical protein